jgi:F1F0 ATPase subunit 2
VSVAGAFDLARAALPFVLLGGVLGAVHFATLRLNVRAYLGGAAAWGIGLHLGRVALAGAAFALIARAGALPLLAALAGFVLARLYALRAARVTP